MFQVPAKLHLTLGVMRLFSTEEEVSNSKCVVGMVPYIDLVCLAGKSKGCFEDGYSEGNVSVTWHSY